MYTDSHDGIVMSFQVVSEGLATTLEAYQWRQTTGYADFFPPFRSLVEDEVLEATDSGGNYLNFLMCQTEDSSYICRVVQLYYWKDISQFDKILARVRLWHGWKIRLAKKMTSSKKSLDIEIIRLGSYLYALMRNTDGKSSASLNPRHCFRNDKCVRIHMKRTCRSIS